MKLISYAILLVCAMFCHRQAVSALFSDPGPRVDVYQTIDEHNLQGIREILQDQQGFLWLITDYGLFRFDGYDIKPYTNNKLNDNSLPNNAVWDIKQDRFGNIWLATRGGLSKFNPASETFTNFRHDENAQTGLYSNSINRISLGTDDSLWIASDAGINRLDIKTGNIERLNHTMLTHPLITNTKVRKIYQDAQQRVWFSVVKDGLFRSDPNQNIHHFDADPADPGKLNGNAIQTIYQGKTHLWFATQKFIYKFIENTGQFVRYEVSGRAENNSKNIVVHNIMQDKEDRIWVTTLYNGISMMEKDSPTLKPINDWGDAEDKINIQTAYGAIQDNSGVLWFATSSGLTKMNPKALYFNQYIENKGQKNNIRTIFADHNGKVWIGMQKHLYLIDAPGEAPKRVLENIGYVENIQRDNKEQLILTVLGVGFYILNEQTMELTYHPASNGSLAHAPSGNLRNAIFDDQGNLWIGLYFHTKQPLSGLFKYNTANNTYSHLINGITVDTILPIGKQVLIGTKRSGMKLYDSDNNSWTDITHAEQDLSRVRQIIQDSKQRIWFTTDDAGLGKLDLDTLSMTFIDTTKGLPSNFTLGLMEGQDGLLWVTTTNGIARYNPDDGHIDTLGPKDGLHVFAHQRRILAQSTAGEIFAGSLSSLYSFFPDQVLSQSDNTDYPILLTDFKLLNRTVDIRSRQPESPLSKPIHFLDKLTLSYRDYLFSLKFASSNYVNSQNTRYAYRLFGYNNDWIQTDSKNRIATFTSLPADSYQLQIKSSRPDGLWSDNYRTINLTITPPWYLSKTAYISYVLLTILAIYLFIKVRTERLVKQAKALEETVQVRTQELKASRDQVTQLLGQKERTFANISHEFKTPLTLILSPLEALLGRPLQNTPTEEISNKLSMMKRNGSRLLRMVEQMLELSRLDSATNQQERHYSLSETLNVLTTSFQPLLDSKSLTLSSNTFDDVVLTLKIDSLEMILTNLISNAIKYTPSGGQVSINVQPSTDTVMLTVSDTGMGISEADQQLVFNRFTRASAEHDEKIPGAGIGLALVKELVESHGGTISLTSQPGKGSSFTVILPVNRTLNVQPEHMGSLSSTSMSEIDALMGASIETQPQAIAHLSNSSKPSVLLIDDNADMLQLLADTLNEHYDCMQASNGEQGLEMAKEFIPDFIISDVMMPGISGYEVAKALKEDELTCHIPVILLTAKGDIDSRMEGWKQDIDDYLAKPFHPQELLLRIESLLSIRQILKKRFIQSANPESQAHDGDTAQGLAAFTPLVPVISDRDHQFLERYKKCIAENYHDSEFSRDVCAKQMGISDRQLSRKINALMDDNFSDYLRDYRLNQSLSLFKTGKQIGQISDEVGFSAIAYFSRCFKAKYGQTPKQYQKTVVI